MILTTSTPETFASEITSLSLKVNGSKEVWVTVGNYWNVLKWILGLTLNGSNDIHLNYGREEMEAQWALAQRTLHGLQAPETSQISSTKRAATQNCLKLQSRLRGYQKLQGMLREMLTLNGNVESVVKLQGLDIDTIQHHYTVLPQAAPLRRTEPDEARPISVSD
ncbi:hypothetical protein Tco_0624281 [Tanacetum coccineum]|uniref:Uncharacterized protein n=1 Tax=Tanacetum coccineum TaxID=301880 RepID=A0ABQ4WDH9_9ASTR